MNIPQQPGTDPVDVRLRLHDSIRSAMGANVESVAFSVGNRQVALQVLAGVATGDTLAESGDPVVEEVVILRALGLSTLSATPDSASDSSFTIDTCEVRAGKGSTGLSGTFDLAASEEDLRTMGIRERAADRDVRLLRLLGGAVFDPEATKELQRNVLRRPHLYVGHTLLLQLQGRAGV